MNALVSSGGYMKISIEFGKIILKVAEKFQAVLPRISVILTVIVISKA